MYIHLNYLFYDKCFKINLYDDIIWLENGTCVYYGIVSELWYDVTCKSNFLLLQGIIIID